MIREVHGELRRDQVWIGPPGAPLGEAAFVTIPGAARRLGVTHRSASLNVEKLVRAGVLREATGRRRNRIFFAPDIVRIAEAETAPIPGAGSRPRPRPGRG